MPYAIPVSDGAAGVARYQLGGSEEWQLQAGSVYFDMTHSHSTDPLFLEARSPTGSVIYRQLLVYVGYNTFVSFAVGSEPFFVASGGSWGWPQEDGGDEGTVTVRVSPVTLTPGCTVYLYAVDGIPDPAVDPLTNLDTGVVVSDVLLWVEDVNALGRDLPGVGKAILLGVGA